MSEVKNPEGAAQKVQPAPGGSGLDLDARVVAYLRELAERDLDTDSPLPRAILAMVDRYERQRAEIARLRDALSTCRAHALRGSPELVIEAARAALAGQEGA